MNIDFAMIWDQLNTKYRDLETPLYGSHLIRGIKLLPENSNTEADFLYLAAAQNGILLSCNGLSDQLNTDLPLEILFNDLQDIFNQLRDWDMEIHLALIEGCEPQKLLDFSQTLLGNPMTLMDPSYKLLAITSQDETSSSIFNQVHQLGYLSAEAVEFYRLQGYIDALAHSGNEVACRSIGSYVSVICPLRINGILTGFLTMPCINRPYSQGVAECFHNLAEGISLCMERQLHTSDINRYMYEYLLIDILSKKLTDPDILQERLRYIDLPVQGQFVLMSMESESEYAALTNYRTRQITELLPTDRAFLYQNQILVLLDEKRLDWATETLLPFLRENHLSCGISQHFQHLLAILPAYQQARAALRLGTRISTLRTLEHLGLEHLSYETSIYHYANYIPYHMVEGAAEHGILSPHLLRLIYVDQQEHMDHLRVLHSYLSCEQRPTQTAAALHMHRNNVIYRIHRIESMLGITLNTPAIRRALECSFLVLELMETERLQEIAQNAQ